MKEFDYFKKIMSFNNKKDLYNNYFSWIYPFTNENIKGYYELFDFEDKDILCVTSSGDHVINSIFKGAKNIDAFDQNILSKYYTELKIGAIKTLSLEEFINFFYNKCQFSISNNYYNKDYYKIIRNVLKKDVCLFWDNVFSTYTSKELYKSFIFTDDFLNLKTLKKVNYYLNSKNYNKLKNIIDDVNINYYDLDIKEISNMKKQYDLIFLSNISSYLEKVYDTNDERVYLYKFKYLLNSLKSNNIVFAYLYSNLISSNSGIYNFKLVNNIIGKYSIIDVISAEYYNSPIIYSLFNNKSDKVLVKK